MPEQTGDHHVNSTTDGAGASSLQAAHSALAAAALGKLAAASSSSFQQSQAPTASLPAETQQLVAKSEEAISAPTTSVAPTETPSQQPRQSSRQRTTKQPDKYAPPQPAPPENEDERQKAKSVRQVRQERKRKIQKEAKQQAAKKSKNNNGGEEKPIVVATTDTGDDYFEMEDVVGRRMNKGRVEYLIKWKGCPHSDNTWEPTTNLCDTALSACIEFSKNEKKKRLQQLQDEERLGLTGGDNKKDTAKSIKLPPIIISKEKKQEEQQPEQQQLVPDHWDWTDEEHVVFREVERINVHDKNSRQRVTDARVNGTPIVLVGHVGWANFAKRWLKPIKINSSSTATAGIIPANGSDITKNNSNMPANGGDSIQTKSSINSTQADGADTAQNKSSTIPTNGSDTTQGISSSSSTPADSVDTKPTENENNSSTPANGGDATLNKSSSGNAPAVVSDTTQNEFSNNKILANVGDITLNKSNSSNLPANCGDTALNKSSSSNNNTPAAGGISNGSNMPAAGGDTTRNESNAEKSDKNSWLDLSQPYELDIDGMVDDIGYEEVPVVKRDYNEMNPIQGNIAASRFLQNCWPKDGKKNNDDASSSRLYLHQWQFPLSDTAGRKLCHQNNPLPYDILGEDLLKYWSGLPQCKLDSPLQYIFMGRDDTVSKLHRDNGGLEISIAPIQGEKECTLVHRADGATCLYHLQAKIDNVDINAYPLMSQARIWQTTVRPGEILLMPHGTYHQCRNVTPCLSYSRFHLDTVNLAPFLQSMIDEDAEEIAHDEVLWNCTSELIKKVDAVVLDVRNRIKSQQSIPPLTDDVIKTVDTLRSLRHVVREIARRNNRKNAVGDNDEGMADEGMYDNDVAQWYIAKEDETPKMISKIFNIKTADLVKGNIQRLPDLLGNSRLKEGTRIKVSHLDEESLPSCQNNDKPQHDWNILVDDVDMSLHEFRYRQQTQIPPFRPRQWKSLDSVIVPPNAGKEGPMAKADGETFTALVSESVDDDEPSSPATVNNETDREGRTSDSLPSNSNLSIKSCRVGDNVTVRLKTGQYSTGTILNVEHNMHAAYLSFDEYPSTYDEFEPYEKLRIPINGSMTGVEVRHEDVKPGLVVLQLKERGEVYRASVQFTTFETMYRIRLEDITEGPTDRWLPKKAMVQEPPPIMMKKSKAGRKQKRCFDVEENTDGILQKSPRKHINGMHQTNPLEKISMILKTNEEEKEQLRSDEVKKEEETSNGEVSTGMHESNEEVRKRQKMSRIEESKMIDDEDK